MREHVNQPLAPTKAIPDQPITSKPPNVPETSQDHQSWWTDPQMTPSTLISPAKTRRTTQLDLRSQNKYYWFKQLSFGVVCNAEIASWDTAFKNVEVTTSLIIREMQIKLQCGITSHRSEWPSLKSLQITNAGEGVEKRELSYTVGENVNWCSHYGGQYGDSFKN